MKIGQLFVFALIIAVSSAFIQNGKNSGRFFGLSPKSRHNEPLLRTFSLSVVGDFGFANISNFFIKIFEAISQLFDLKAVRKAVDFGFDTFMSKGDSEIYNIMGPQSRNDIYSIEVDDIDNPQMAAQVKKLKEETNLRKSITTAIGGLMQKQECKKQALCFTGVFFRTLPGKDLGLIFAESMSKDTSMKETVDFVAKAVRDETFECNFKCDDSIDGRDI
jgi:hypothetical protein